MQTSLISRILGMEKSALVHQDKEQGGMMAMILSIDWRSQVWKAGVTFTDNSFQYQLWYFIFSILGNYNYFFFAAHLIDMALCVPALIRMVEALKGNPLIKLV